MRAYADTSFLVKLLVKEAGSEKAMGEYRRLEYPRLFLLPLHRLEAANAIRQRAFHERRSATGRQRASVVRERDAALARLDHWASRGWLIEVDGDWDDTMRRAQALSERHTERLGCRAFDLLHVASALALESEVFLTADRVQATLARAEGLAVVVC
jgi:predicted nucleic acid-binding protein